MKLSNSKLQLIVAEQCLTWKELCERAGIDISTIKKVRTGERNPKPSTIGKIAKALNVSVQDIIEDMD